MSIPTLGAGLLVAGGLINALPPVSERLTRTFSGKPIVQVLVGVASVIIGCLLIVQNQ